MKSTRNIAVALATLAFGAVPAVAVASGGGNSNNAPGHSKTTTSTSSTSNTSNTSNTSKAAFGRICASENLSKKHSSSSPTGKSEFALCVVALAQANKNTHMSAKAACKALSKKRDKTATPKAKGTPFSECMSAIEKMRHGHTS